MKKLKAISFILAIAMVIAMLTGCSSQEKATPEAPTNPTNQTNNETQETPSEKQEANPVEQTSDSQLDLDVPTLESEASLYVREYYLSNYAESSPEDVYEKVSKLEDSFSLRDGFLFKGNEKLCYPLLARVPDGSAYVVFYLSDYGSVENEIVGGRYYSVPSVYTHYDGSSSLRTLSRRMFFNIMYDETNTHKISIWSFDKVIASYDLPVSGKDTVYCGYSSHLGYIFRVDNHLIIFSASYGQDKIPVLTGKIVADNVQRVLDSDYQYHSDLSGQILLQTTDGAVKVLCESPNDQLKLVDPLYEGSYNSQKIRP